MPSALTIVIPNYNGAHLLANNLPSVIKAGENYAGAVSIIVVDDASVDESLTVLDEQFSQVKVIQHATNLGFAEAVHTGVAAAETELLLLLNTDVQLPSNGLDLLAEYFQNPNVFSVCPLVIDEDGKINRHSWIVRRYQFGNLKPIQWDMDTALYARQRAWLATLYTSGGSVMLRKSMFVALGGFCSLFKPFYSEDYDLGLRAWRRGWPSYFEPRITVIHQSRGSIKENVKRAYVKQIRRRNGYLIAWIHFPLWRLFLFYLPVTAWRLLGELLMLDKVNLKGFTGALTLIPAVFRARAELKQTEQLTMRQVLQCSQLALVDVSHEPADVV